MMFKILVLYYVKMVVSTLLKINPADSKITSAGKFKLAFCIILTNRERETEAKYVENG